MKSIKYLLILTSLLTITLILTACSGTSGKGNNNASASGNTAQARTLDEIKKSGTIKIGVFSDKKPFGYVDDKGDYQGYDVYFAKRLAKDLGVDVEFVAVDPASRVEYLTSAKVDIILANFTVTKERSKQVDFASPYMKVSLGVVSPSDALITSVDQLKGKTLIVGKGTTAETYFESNYPDVNLQKYDQYSEAYQALLDGRGDALSTDNTEVLAWALENDGYKVGIKALGNVDTIAPAVQKDNTELLKWINNEIETLGKENFFHTDYEETLEPIYGDAANAEDLVVEGGKVE
ncbi:cysteine ABC transporter substrate-binding protein [Streptococcus dentiloxodontae]